MAKKFQPIILSIAMWFSCKASVQLERQKKICTYINFSDSDINDATNNN